MSSRYTNNELKNAFNTKVDNPHLQKTLPFLKEFSLAMADLKSFGVDIDIEIFPTNAPYVQEWVKDVENIPVSGILTVHSRQVPFGIITEQNGENCALFFLGETDYRLDSTKHDSGRGKTYNLTNKETIQIIQDKIIDMHKESMLLKENDPGDIFNKKIRPHGSMLKRRSS